MKWNLKQHGDALEVEAADFVYEHISYYESIWAKFIGHQGNGQMINIKDLNQDVSRTRDDFAQNHYTILESLYFMYKIATEQRSPRTITTFDEYRKLIDAITAYFAYCGKVRDSLYQCFILMGAPNQPDPVIKLKPFWDARHSFLHGKKIPLRFNESGHYKMPVMANINNQNAWEGKLTWVEANNIQFDYVGEALFKMFNEMAQMVASLLAELYKRVDKFCKKNNIVLPEPTQAYQQPQQFYNATSGSTLSIATINVSGVTR